MNELGPGRHCQTPYILMWKGDCKIVQLDSDDNWVFVKYSILASSNCIAGNFCLAQTQIFRNSTMITIGCGVYIESLQLL